MLSAAPSFAFTLLVSACTAGPAPVPQAPAPPATRGAEPGGVRQAEEAPAGGVLRFGDPRELAYDEPFFPGASYDPAVPAPETTLGAPVGSRLARHDEILACFRALAGASPRVTLERHGLTHEGRELVHAVITSPANHARLEEILADHRRLHDPRGLGEDEADAILARSVPIAWMGYSVHGDELSGCDAAIALGYHLAAATDPDVLALLERVVVVIDPCMNPDGRQRILAMVEQTAGYALSLDHDSMQRGRWPYGRGNHYLFDLNRDWMAGTQPETRARWAAVLRFHPELFVDAHEMGPLDTFLFYPQEPPLNPFLPERHAYWHRELAADLARAFDARGWAYYTREWADGWAPFYSDAWSSLIGGVGMLYEQARTSGYPLRRASGVVTTYRETVHHQVEASITSLRTLAARADEVLADHAATKRRDVDPDAPGNDRALVVVPGANRSREREWLAILLGQEIEVFTAREAFEATGVEHARGGRADAREIEAGAWIVPARQPMGPLVKAYLALDPRLDEAALRAEREELEQVKESRVYDLTAWSLPHALDLDALWCDAPDVPVDRVAAPPPAPAGGVSGDLAPEATVAWAVDAADDAALRFAARALEAGLAVHASDRGFTAAGRAFARGSFLVRRHETPGTPAEIAAAVDAAARAAGVEAHALATGRSPDAGPDLGGGRFALLARPRAAILANAPVEPDLFGHLWHALDVGLGVPASMLDAQAFAWADLRRYNVLVLPPGSGGFLERHAEALGAWVEAGGTLIAVEDAAAAATEHGLSDAVLRRNALEDLELYRAAAERERAAYAVEIDPEAVWDGPQADAGGAEAEDGHEPEPPTEEEDERARLFSPYGVTLKAELAPRHWITAGATDPEHRMPVFFSRDRVLHAKGDVAAAVRLAPAAELRLGGLLWPEARERIADSAWLTVESRGSGQVILFPCMPALRGYHAATARLFGNAVVLGPGLGASQPVGW